MTLKTFFQQPDPPVIPRDAYVPPLMTNHEGQDITSLQPGAGQNAVPTPQTLYDLASYRTPFSWLWRRPRNLIKGA